jgi:hypothetical protein
MSAEGLILAGNIRMAPINADGTLGKLKLVGNATKFGIKPNSQKKQQISKQRGSYGAAITTVYLAQPSDVTMTLERIDQQNLLYQFLGEASTYTQTASTVANESVTMHLDGWVKLAGEKISAFALTDGAPTPVTYTAGVDYEVNNDIGMVRAIPGGAIADASICKAGYTQAAITDGTSILGATKSSIRVYIHLEGENLADGSLVLGEFWDVTLTPDQELDFLSDNLVQIGLTGALIKPAAKPSPFVIRQRTP